MSALSDYLEAKLLDLVYNGVAFSSSFMTFIALYTSDPTDADVGTEVSGGNYARFWVWPPGFGQVCFTLAAADGIGHMVSNAEDWVWAAATAPWGTITHFGIRTLDVGGNLLHHGPLDEPQVIGTGGVFKIPAGALKLRME